jgi:hypothetical protein
VPSIPEKCPSVAHAQYKPPNFIVTSRNIKPLPNGRPPRPKGDMEAGGGRRIPPPLPLSRTIGGEGKQRRPIGASIQPPPPPFPASLYSLHISLLWASFYSAVQAYTNPFSVSRFFGFQVQILLDLLYHFVQKRRPSDFNSAHNFSHFWSYFLCSYIFLFIFFYLSESTF